MSVSPTTLQVPEVRILSILFISGITVPGMLLVLSKCVAVE